MKNLSFLKNEWTKLTSGYDAPQTIVNNTFSKIRDAYSASSRHYHNLDHIGALLDSAAEYRDQISDHDSLLFAVWFHDLVYNASASDNEEKSAESAEKVLPELNVPPDRISKVSDMILATKNHMAFKGDDQDTKLFLDFDLKILGVEPDVYMEYSRQIRQEYRLIPDFLYNPGRKKVLRKFLDAEYLFKTPEFRKRFEGSAKRNIQSELELL